MALASALPAAATCASAAATAPHAPLWQVYAIRYATIPAFPVRDLVAGADTTRTLDIAMMFWLLKGPGGRCVLVDAGFHRPKFIDSWRPKGFVSPAEALRRLGVPPDSITDIIVTTVQWDHVDGVDLFPKAHVWFQEKEYEYYINEEGMLAHAGIDSLDVEMLAGIERAGRLRLMDRAPAEVLPGITSYTGGMNTFASQYLTVRTANGTVVLAGHDLGLYENLDRHAAIAQTLDAASNLAAQDRMKQLASSRRLIVPGHDPAVFRRFHAVIPGVVKIE